MEESSPKTIRRVHIEKAMPDELVEKRTQGTFTPQGREDILVVAISHSNHPRCVRGVRKFAIGGFEYCFLSRDYTNISPKVIGKGMLLTSVLLIRPGRNEGDVSEAACGRRLLSVVHMRDRFWMYKKNITETNP
ncbi:hypothetical protein V8G54_003455 [Vigna mungo]|uniref:Uncharacterized protein n=1 Tax=Vigna mungo TaxID=3915 RepID=A0AAQ3PA29_VIGMU